MDPARLGDVESVTGCCHIRFSTRRFDFLTKDRIAQGRPSMARAERAAPPDDDKTADERRDAGLLRMLKTPPKHNKDLKLGKPRNPRHKAKKTKEEAAAPRRPARP
jgi:hypothetical protein